MPKIHPTSTIGPEVQLADDVEIGPGCLLSGAVRIGAGTVLMGHCYLNGPIEIGVGNRLFPFVCLGYEPQDWKYDPTKNNAGVVIGARNLLREHVTIHSATTADRPTRIGDDNMMMVYSHLAHDVELGSHCVLAGHTGIGGHTVLEDRVSVGGGSQIAPKIRVGRLNFVGGAIGLSQNTPPFMIARRGNAISGLNLIGLRRVGMPREEIDQLRWAFRVLYLRGLARRAAVEVLRERAAASPAVAELVQFLERISGALTPLEEGAFRSARNVDDGVKP